MAIGHAGDVVADGLHLFFLRITSAIRRQQPRFCGKGLEEFAHHGATLHRHAVNAMVLVEAIAQEALDAQVVSTHPDRQGDQRFPAGVNVLRAGHTGIGDADPAGVDEIGDLGIDRAADHLVREPALLEARPAPAHLGCRRGKGFEREHLLQIEQPGAQPVVHIVVVVGDLVGEVGDLRQQNLEIQELAASRDERPAEPRVEVKPEPKEALTYNDVEILRALAEESFVYGNLAAVCERTGLGRDFVSQRLTLMKSLGVIETRINDKNVLHWFVSPRGKQVLSDILAGQEEKKIA